MPAIMTFAELSQFLYRPDLGIAIRNNKITAKSKKKKKRTDFIKENFAIYCRVGWVDLCIQVFLVTQPS